MSKAPKKTVVQTVMAGKRAIRVTFGKFSARRFLVINESRRGMDAAVLKIGKTRKAEQWSVSMVGEAGVKRTAILAKTPAKAFAKAVKALWV